MVQSNYIDGQEGMERMRQSSEIIQAKLKINRMQPMPIQEKKRGGEDTDWDRVVGSCDIFSAVTIVHSF